MPRNHLLDQVSSQALIRLAAARDAALTAEPAGEEAFRPPSQSWTRLAPYLFFALGLLALGGMALAAFNLSEDGWSASDATQLALLALLVAGILQQARSLPVIRRLVRRWRPSPLPVVAAGLASENSSRFRLDAVSAEELAASHPATLPRSDMRSAARKTTGRWLERGAVVAVVMLSVLAFAGMVFLCVYIATTSGFADPGLWLTFPFAALTGFASYQVFRQARRAAFRGRPWSLVTRAFRDSVRVWSSGSLVTNVLLTSTATASVAGAAIAPVIAPNTNPYDLFLVDANSGAYYRVDLATMVSARVGASADGFVTIGLHATEKPAALADGTKLPRGTIVNVLESPQSVQVLVALRPGLREPIAVARLQSPLAGAYFATGNGRIFVLEPDGTLSTIQPLSGAVTRIGVIDAPFGPIAYDPSTDTISLVSGTVLSRVDPASGRVISSIALQVTAGFEACGLSRAGRSRLFVAERSTGSISLIDTASGATRQFTPTGELPATACVMTVAFRK